MASTLTTYRTSVQLLGYDALATATIDAAVQAARRRVVTARRWSWAEASSAALATVANTATVALTTVTDLGYLDAVRLSDGTTKLPCSYKPYSVIRDLQDNYADTGTPEFWSRRGTNLVFYPTPSRAFTVTIEYTTLPAAITTTDSLIPEVHADLVVWAAVVPLAFRQRGMTESSAADQYYSKVLLREHAAQDAAEQRQTSTQVKTGYWGD